MKLSVSRGSSLLSWLLLKASVTDFTGLVCVFVMVLAVTRTWSRQRKIFCLRLDLVMFGQGVGLVGSLMNRMCSDGDGGAERQLLETPGIFGPVFGDKSSYSIPTLKMLMSCLQLDKLYKDM